MLNGANSYAKYSRRDHENPCNISTSSPGRRLRTTAQAISFLAMRKFSSCHSHPRLLCKPVEKEDGENIPILLRWNVLRAHRNMKHFSPRSSCSLPKEENIFYIRRKGRTGLKFLINISTIKLCFGKQIEGRRMSLSKRVEQHIISTRC